MNLLTPKNIILILIVLLFNGCGFDITSNIEDDANITDNKQEVRFSSSHPGSQHIIDFDARTLTVNEVDRTVDTTVVLMDKNSTLIYAPTDEFVLPEGNVTIYIKVPYKSRKWWRFGRNAIEGKVSFFVDSIAPTVSAISPEDGGLIADALTPLTYSVSDDNGSGIDSNSIKFYIDNIDKTEFITLESDILTYTPPSSSPLPLSSFKVDITLSDILGNDTNATFSYTAQPQIVLGAFPRAVPQTAVVPATIRFSPVVTTDTAIQRYDWDLDGDGSFERGDLVGNSYTYTYTQPGDYNVSLKIIDANGETLIGSTVVSIINLPPEVSAEATPSNGAIPLEVSFTVNAVDNEGIAKYEWDFQGDGTYDYESLSSGSTLYTYAEVGTFIPSIRVTDTTGISAVYSLPTTTVNAAVEGSPSVIASSSVYSGSAPLVTTLYATASDPQGQAFTLWEWDYDGDGSYDYTSEAGASVEYTFTKSGIFFPRVRATTVDGRSCVDAIEIKVTNNVSISRDLDTIDLVLGESSTVTTTISGDSKVSIIIESRDNQVVRTLVDWIERPAGTYADVWDGLANDGSKLVEADYYAVLLYEDDGEVKRLDLRDTTGGTQFNPSRNNAQRSFSPFDNDPMSITFNLSQAAEVTAFMGYSYSNTRVVTFFSRKPMPKGSHNVKWHSTNSEGILIKAPPGKYFMYGNWAYTLASNAIYVKSGAYVTGVSVEPVIFDPTSHKAEGLRSTANISFNLTSDASVELTVVDAETGLMVAYKKYSDLFSGSNTIEWDGRNSAGEFIAPGKFSIGLRAIDDTGYSSLIQYTLLRIYY